MLAATAVAPYPDRPGVDAGVARSGLSLRLWDASMRAIPVDRRLYFVGVLYSIDFAIIFVVPIVPATVAQGAGAREGQQLEALVGHHPVVELPAHG